KQCCTFAHFKRTPLGRPVKSGAKRSGEKWHKALFLSLNRRTRHRKNLYRSRTCQILSPFTFSRTKRKLPHHPGSPNRQSRRPARMQSEKSDCDIPHLRSGTLHSILGIKTSFSENPLQPLFADLILVDECSM